MYKATFILVFLISVNTYSQIITIPDPVFKSMLLADVDINTNGDNEIQLSEAEAAVGVFVTINANDPNKIEDLEGLQYFTNIYELDIGGHSIDSLDVTMLPNLSIVNCQFNGMTSLNVSGLALLEHLWIMGNNITSLDLTGLNNLYWLWTDDNPLTELDIQLLPALEWVWCERNNLTDLDFLPLSNVKRIRCGGNQISNLDVNHLTGLSELRCDENIIAAIDLSGLQNLTTLEIGDNLISQLDVTQTSVRQLYCKNNPNLTQILAANLVISNANQFDFSNNPQLDYICIDAGEEGALAQSGYNPANVSVSTTGCTLRINENTITSSIAVFPNPFGESANIITDFQADSFHITDVSGKMLWSSPDELKTEAAMASLSTGLYFLTVYNDASPVILKFIKN